MRCNIIGKQLHLNVSDSISVGTYPQRDASNYPLSQKNISDTELDTKKYI